MKNALLALTCLLFAQVYVAAQPIPVTFTNRNSLMNGGVGGGIADCAVDMNGDYLDDIVRVHNNGLSIFFQNPDGTLTNQFFSVGFQNSPNWSICAADLNNDGFNDLLFGGGSRVSFVMSDGENTSYREQFIDDYIFSQRSTFHDIDRDGDLDAFVCHDVDLSHPYRNDGQGHMTEDQDLIHTVNLPGNYAAIWVDYNNDDFTDLYITKCRGGAAPGNPARTNAMYRNNGDGTFTEVGAEINMADNAQSWSTVFEDFDNDGDFDAFTVNHDFQNRFMVNDGTGVFTDIIAQTGIPPDALGAWENNSGDFNNDGFVDILAELPNQLHLNNGDLTFTGQNAPVDEGGIGDFNNDGFLDIVNGGNLWINDGNDNNWVKFNTQGILSNRNGIGARVELYGAWGKQIREVRAGTGFSPMASLCTHFGIGSATSIDSVVVKWPSGTRTVLPNPAINTSHLLLEASCVLAPIAIEIIGETELCEGETVQLVAPGGYEFVRWSTGVSNPSLEISEPGSYSLIAFDDNNCVAIAPSVAITRVADVAPVIQVDGDLRFCAGSSVQLSIENGTNPVWSNGSTGEVVAITESGTYNVRVDAVCSTEGIEALESVTIEVLEADVPVIESVEVDANGVAQITAANGPTEVYWYSDATGGDVLASGFTFQTEPLTENTVYYVEGLQSYEGNLEYGGKPSPGLQGGIPSSGAYSYFDAYEPFTILSVEVMVPTSQQPGERTIQLFDSEGNMLLTKTIMMEVGLQRVPLNFDVPVGTNFSLRCPENNLFRDNGGVQYPYPIGDLGAITTSFFGTQYYYYFYNWEVKAMDVSCVSERVPVEVIVVGVDEIEAVNNLNLFPNPASTTLNLRLDLEEQIDLDVQLINALGQQMYSTHLSNLPKGQITHQINVAQLPAGVYQLQLRQGDKRTVRKVVIE